MRKIILTEYQVKKIINNLMKEQENPINPLDKKVLQDWNMYMNMVIDEKRLSSLLSGYGLKTGQNIADYLYSKPELYNPIAVSSLLKDLGLKQLVKNIDTSSIPNVNPRANRKKLKGGSSSGSGSERLTGPARISSMMGCSGGYCPLNEQDEESNQTKAVQKFLNQKFKLGLSVDGQTGKGTKTSQGIAKYQTMLGVYPVDGIWGDNTYQKMPPADKQLFDKISSENDDIFDTMTNQLQNLFN
jgi:hypothetical protein